VTVVPAGSDAGCEWGFPNPRRRTINETKRWVMGGSD
jgi:hypothetical protein